MNEFYVLRNLLYWKKSVSHKLANIKILTLLQIKNLLLYKNNDLWKKGTNTNQDVVIKINAMNPTRIRMQFLQMQQSTRVKYKVGQKCDCE